MYNYINYIFANNKVNFNYDDEGLNVKMKFKVNEHLKEITFPLDKRNMNQEQSMASNKILVKLVNKLQNTIKLKNEKINALRIDKSNNKDIKKIKIESKIINNKELKFIEENIREEEDDDSKNSKFEIQFKILFNVNIYEQNIINQLIDFSEQFENQCLAIIEFFTQKICIIFTNKNSGNYCLLINEEEKFYIKEFYIDKDKFCFKLNEGKESNNSNNSIKNYLVKEFIQMEFFNLIFTKD